MNTSAISPLLVHSKSDSVEVRALKELLANVSCGSNNCNRLDDNKSNTRRSRKLSHVAATLKGNLRHSKVQTECHVTPYYVPSTIKGYDRFDCNSQNLVCPMCFFTTHVLRGDYVKIVKDEKCGTELSISTSDKGTERNVNYLEKSTSNTSVLPLFSYEMNGYTSSSDSSGSCRYHCQRNPRKAVYDRFNAPLPEENCCIEENTTSPRCCVEMENFINCIRPPIAGNCLPTDILM
ncbi:unnamed protein product [Arctia plantaginis]|uniref:Uncharacterized protein n=1 Tax=Arctia plantaginis TaxID=874455 RepID=A0A8S0Z2Q5_ARCPL|nr:unnamed protein product [Arctia plantaginis]